MACSTFQNWSTKVNLSIKKKFFNISPPRTARIKKVEAKIFIDDDTSSDKEKDSLGISNLFPASITHMTRSH